MNRKYAVRRITALIVVILFILIVAIFVNKNRDIGLPESLIDLKKLEGFIPKEKRNSEKILMSLDKFDDKKIFSIYPKLSNELNQEAVRDVVRSTWKIDGSNIFVDYIEKTQANILSFIFIVKSDKLDKPIIKTLNIDRDDNSILRVPSVFLPLLIDDLKADHDEKEILNLNTETWVYQDNQYKFIIDIDENYDYKTIDIPKEFIEKNSISTFKKMAIKNKRETAAGNQIPISITIETDLGEGAKKALEILKGSNARVTFFTSINNLRGNNNLAREIAQDYEIEIYSPSSESDLSVYYDETLRSEVTKSTDSYREITLKENKFYRPVDFYDSQLPILGKMIVYPDIEADQFESIDDLVKNFEIGSIVNFSDDEESLSKLNTLLSSTKGKYTYVTLSELFSYYLEIDTNKAEVYKNIDREEEEE